MMKKKWFKLQSVALYLLLTLLTYYAPELMLFYLICGVYDVSRNSNLDLSLLRRYFLGNGLLTWLLAPVNILMDLFTLPFVNKKIYQMHDLPIDCQQEIARILEVVKSQNILNELTDRVENVNRGMIFFKWYGKNIDNFIDVPVFHEEYKYIKTIGISVFNKRVRSREHFGPLRATLRLLYNINDVSDRESFIKVRSIENHWCDNKLFIFDDTLSHQSFNEIDGIRYCLFVDILRPSQCNFVLEFFVRSIATVTEKIKFIFYNHWVPLK
jgi:aspartyl/asparaginyl beta-hydroxylase (cupin superfamily)